MSHFYDDVIITIAKSIILEEYGKSTLFNLLLYYSNPKTELTYENIKILEKYKIIDGYKIRWEFISIINRMSLYSIKKLYRMTF